MRNLHTLTAAAVLLVLGTQASAEGFGTPTIDGVIDGVYGAAEAMDPSDDPQGNAPMDMLDLYVCNDDNFWYFAFTVDDDLVANNWGKYILSIDTTNDLAGGTLDAWGRNVIISDPHKSEYTVRSWVDGGGTYSEASTQLWSWDGAAWNLVSAIDDAALAAGTPSTIEWKISRADIGDPAEIWCEVWSTGGTDTDNAQDTSNDPADDWTAVDWGTTAVLSNSTHVVRQSGADTTPPTVVSATATGQEPIINIDVTFSEPVQNLGAGNFGVSDGITVIGASSGDNITYSLMVDVLGYGTCYDVTATGVLDIAGNPIVEDGVQNAGSFQIWDILFKANMNLYLRDNGAPPNDVSIEGSTLPLTWDPICDDLLADADGDSVYTGRFQFVNACVEGQSIEYKFNHNCGTYESISNHFYGFDLTVARDTLDIWWDDQAPTDFTGVAVPVIFQVDMTDAPFAPGVMDTVAVNGSQPPLTWDVPPAMANWMVDDGTGDDVTAGDNVWTARATFPENTFKNVFYKYILNDMYECEGQDNRDVFLDDTVFNEANPLVLPVVAWDACVVSVGEAGFGPASLLAVRPNPVYNTTAISFELTEAANVELSVFDVQGREVRRLHTGALEAGGHDVAFDGANDDGLPLASGVYFVRLRAGGAMTVQQLSLVR